MSIPITCECKTCKKAPRRLIFSNTSGIYYFVCNSCPEGDSNYTEFRRLTDEEIKDILVRKMEAYRQRKK
jgi:protein-arginine kinase activator protein McsA